MTVCTAMTGSATINDAPWPLPGLSSQPAGSMGGMRALEWAVALPDRVATLFFLASDLSSYMTGEVISVSSQQA